MYLGRTQQQMDDLAKAITDAVGITAKAPRDQTIVVIQEVPKEQLRSGQESRVTGRPLFAPAGGVRAWICGGEAEAQSELKACCWSETVPGLRDSRLSRPGMELSYPFFGERVLCQARILGDFSQNRVCLGLEVVCGHWRTRINMPDVSFVGQGGARIAGLVRETRLV